MPIQRASQTPSKQEKQDLEQVLGKGMSSTPSQSLAAQKDLNFPMRITGEVAEVFEKARNEASLSRRSWVMLAIVEKLKREGKIQ